MNASSAQVTFRRYRFFPESSAKPALLKFEIRGTTTSCSGGASAKICAAEWSTMVGFCTPGGFSHQNMNIQEAHNTCTTVCTSRSVIGQLVAFRTTTYFNRECCRLRNEDCVILEPASKSPGWLQIHLFPPYEQPQRNPQIKMFLERQVV